MIRKYNAMVSSDWNGCLAPCGPFDFISFENPKLKSNLTSIFRQYTGNLISLGEAAGQIRKLLPEPITPDQMDAYLDESFSTYTGVPELIEWCSNHNILFMINTTGMIGYFQRIFAKNLLPPVPVVSAHPLIRYPQNTNGSRRFYELLETRDKSKNTDMAARSLAIPAAKIRKLLPEPITPDQMDAYLDESFSTYTGVPELIEWCSNHNILFMLNTTGMIGYFQRIFAKNLLPPVPVVSAHPLIRYPQNTNGSSRFYELLETRDKSKNTDKVARSLAIPASKIILLGDSGGDGPHFEWGRANGAFLVGSITKPSLDVYCRNKDIYIDLRFGLDYSRPEKRNPQEEFEVNFMDLAATIEEIVDR